MIRKQITSTCDEADRENDAEPHAPRTPGGCYLNGDFEYGPHEYYYFDLPDLEIIRRITVANPPKLARRKGRMRSGTNAGLWIARCWRGLGCIE